MAENRQNDGEYIKKFRAYGVILGTPPLTKALCTPLGALVGIRTNI